MTRNPEICRWILKILDDCGSYALPDATLAEHLQIQLRPRMTAEEFERAKTFCQQKGWIDSLDGEFGAEDRRWLITERGQVARRQH
jgi:hypothetical protein